MRLKVGGRFRERLVVTLEPLPIDASLHEVMAALQRQVREQCCSSLAVGLRWYASLQALVGVRQWLCKLDMI